MTTCEKGLIPRFVARLGAWLSAALTLFLVCTAPAAKADPVAQFSYSPATPLTNELVTFTSNSTGVTGQTWDLDGDRTCGDVTGPTAQWSFPIADVYSVTLCVRDASGQSASQTLRVTVGNRAPVAAFTYAPAAPLTGERIILSSTSGDPDGPIVAQGWDLDGDGAFDDGAGPTAELSFPTAGLYPVRLAVADRNGATAAAELQIQVREPPPEPLTPFPIVSMLAVVGDRGTMVRELVVRAPVGARIRVRCRGRGCPFRSFVRKAEAQARAARIVRIRRFGDHLLRPGTVIEIRVTKRGEIGKFTRFLIRKGKPPKRTDRCLPPGAKRPKRCT